MNLIPKICELLGVEIGERFKVKGRNYVYKFSEHRVFLECSNGNWLTLSGEIIRELLVGDLVIEKIPFEPKFQDHYFWVSLNKSNFVHDVVMDDYWCGNTNDYQRKYCGNCFRTQTEAKTHKYEVYERLTGKKWEE